ncbi:type 4 fimbrial biogenesis protein PilN [Oceanospirillum sp. MED92]|uniref:Type 4 fimbrial biogenesis protein PilN n=2 Tax=Neptuniibacter caesariensis TaxID=207954 RepID=A0A7U8C732_NEPCE|nr:type 4 fimbrial biogenesis protein PilN [Oceanospirillum sp. MED92] [Neptuniibacter caesariensis]
MATINLRPWREELAQERQKQFSMNLLGAAVFAGLIVFAVGFYFDEMKNRQLERNNYLKAETAKLDKQIAQIKELKAKKEALLQRLNTIQNLQSSRPVIVRNFDELVRVLPDGVHYSSLTRTGANVSITGMAADKLDVSTLMRNLDQSLWFGEPSLSSVGQVQEDSNSFNLNVPVVLPKPEAN